MLTYYLNKNNDVDPAWVDTEAEKAARSFCSYGSCRFAASQLLKFYNDV